MERNTVFEEDQGTIVLTYGNGLVKTIAELPIVVNRSTFHIELPVCEGGGTPPLVKIRLIDKCLFVELWDGDSCTMPKEAKFTLEATKGKLVACDPIPR